VLAPVATVAFGVPVTPPAHGGWDFLPLLGTVLALGALVLGVRLRPSWAVAAGAFAFGNLWAGLVVAWGVVVPSGLAFLAVVAAGAVRRRAHGR
jgi:hypothetical protein